MSKTKNNNPTKTLLIVVVCIIWGAVIFRALSLFSGSSEVHISGANMQDEPIKYKFNNDTFSINVNYRDPFLDRQNKSIVRSMNQNTAKRKPVKQAPKRNVKKNNACVWPVMKFGGMIYNNTSNGTNALFEINGQKKIIQKGDMLNEIRIELITPDSIIVSKENCFKTIHRN
jgi:hypothetical protein